MFLVLRSQSYVPCSFVQTHSCKSHWRLFCSDSFMFQSHTDVPCHTVQTHSFCCSVTLMFPLILFEHIHFVVQSHWCSLSYCSAHSFCCSVTLMFPLILFSTFILLFSHTDVPCHTVQHIHFVVQSHWCSLSYCSNTFILLFSHTDVPSHTVWTHSFCCSVTLMFPLIPVSYTHLTLPTKVNV